MTKSATVLCDWGGTRLRAFLHEDDKIIARREGAGIGSLTGPAASALREVLSPWLNPRVFNGVVMCGMAGSRNGIAETPYVHTPVGMRDWLSQAMRHQTDDFSMLIGAGVRSLNRAGAPDVMRGEETQIFGAFQLNPALAEGEHLLLLPGTHSKWVEVSNGQLMSIQTYITGELFALLSKQSSLLRTAGAQEASPGAFAAGAARARQQGLAESLFETRAAQLTLGYSPGWAREFLSGLLIGNEVSSALTADAARPIVLVGEARLCGLYMDILRGWNVHVSSLDGDECVLAGLRLLASRQP